MLLPAKTCLSGISQDSVLIEKVRNEMGDITTDPEEIQNRSFYKRLYSTKLENMDEMDNFLDTYKIPKLNEDQINNVIFPYPLKK
jgi:hypothetical protein